ncbi:MAG TPA: hypothetical protein VFO81_06510 [Gaiellaceae bacterium]|jgi:hypothetical protein|nr:hypothetical protein [Gaiellaceae bacterium]
MSGRNLASATRFLVVVLGVLYVAAAVAGPFLFDWSAARDTLWVVLLVGGALAMAVAEFALPRGVPAAVLLSAGALVGGFPLFWTLVVPIAVAAVIACSVALARRPAPA